MRAHPSQMRACAAVALAITAGCRPIAESAPSPPQSSVHSGSPVASTVANGEGADSGPHPAGAERGGPRGSEASSADAAELRSPGPYEVPFLDGRTAFVIAPLSRATPQRLIVHLHGACSPPSWSCGSWKNTAAETGFLVCPSGDGSCGPGAPNWTVGARQVDEQMEIAIARVEEKWPGEITRTGAIATGFSRGAYHAWSIAQLHPGRWPYLILIEGNPPLDVPALRAGKVRAVALIAGDQSVLYSGCRQTAAALAARKYPAKLWTMRDTGHRYSADIERIMREAIEFVSSHRE